MSRVTQWSDVVLSSVLCVCFVIVNVREHSAGGLLYDYRRIEYGWPAVYASAHPADLPLVLPHFVERERLADEIRHQLLAPRYRAAQCSNFSLTLAALDLTVAVVSVLGVTYLSQRHLRHHNRPSVLLGALVGPLVVATLMAAWQLLPDVVAALAQAVCFLAVLVVSAALLWRTVTISRRLFGGAQ